MFITKIQRSNIDQKNNLLGLLSQYQSILLNIIIYLIILEGVITMFNSNRRRAFRRNIAIIFLVSLNSFHLLCHFLLIKWIIFKAFIRIISLLSSFKLRCLEDGFISNLRIVPPLSRLASKCINLIITG